MKQTLLLLFFLLFSPITLGQEIKFIPYKSKDYPVSDYEIKKESHVFNDFTVTILHVKLKISLKFFCRFWLTVTKGDILIDRKYYADCESLGGCCGIFPDKIQPEEYFTLTKCGDYNGQLIIIDKIGKISIHNGGTSYISDDSRYLFSIHGNDINTGVTIFDLSKNRIVYDKEAGDETLMEVFYKDNKYFISIYEEEKKTGKTQISIFDFKELKFTHSVVNDTYIKSAKKLRYIGKYIDNCQCGNK